MKSISSLFNNCLLSNFSRTESRIVDVSLFICPCLLKTAGDGAAFLMSADLCIGSCEDLAP
jgi:hypothetical protein